MEFNGPFNPISAQRARDLLGISTYFDELATDISRLRHLGFNGNGQNLKLSDRFGNDLAAAKAVFPSAVSVNEYMDGCCIERVLQLNIMYYGRTSITLPACGALFSRTLDTYGTEPSIRGSGRGVTQLILAVGNMTLIRHGIGENPPPPTPDPYVTVQRQFQIANLSLKCEVPTGTNVNTRALDISFFEHTGVFFQTCVRDVDIEGFTNPVRILNPNRGTQFDTVGIYGPHSTTQKTAAIEIVTSMLSRQNSGTACFKSVRTANYRWGWDVYMDPADQNNKETRRSMEGFIFIDSGSVNGWGMVRANNTRQDYSSLLWEFHGCDYQGSGHALHMYRCNQIFVNGGYWIINGKPPQDDEADPMGYPERRLFSFQQCYNVRLQNMRMDCGGDVPPHILVDIDQGCYDVRLKDNMIVDLATNLVAGFRIQGAYRNAIYEQGTFWQAWVAPADKRVVDVSANQLSATNVSAYGTVDYNGRYTLTGLSGVITTDSNGNARFEFPRRPLVSTAGGGTERIPFFQDGNYDPILIPRAAVPIPSISIISTDVFGVNFTFGSGFANRGFQIHYHVIGT